MSELPRLDALCRRGIVADARLGVPVHHRVLDRDALDRGVPERREEFRSLIEVSPEIALGQPANTAVAEPGAGRVSDEQVPPTLKQIPGVTDDVFRAAVLRREQVAGPGIMPARREGTTDNAGELACDENAHQMKSPLSIAPSMSRRQARISAAVAVRIVISCLPISKPL